MSDNPTPAILDKKKAASKEGMIIFHQPVIDSNGVHTIKTHGPMPISKWAAYEKENGL